MAESLSVEETILDIPASLVTRKKGFSIDFGASFIKMAYSSDHGETVRIHFVSFPTENMREAILHLASKLTDDMPKVNVYTCGLGCNEHVRYIEDTLRCRLLNIMERDCFVDGFQFLTRHYPLDEVTCPESEEVTKYAEKLASALAKEHIQLATKFPKICRGAMWESSKSFMGKEHGQRPLSSGTIDKVEYPLILGVCGSATQILKVEEDGSYICLEVVPVSGKTILGLSSLLTGTQDFEELASWADHGCLQNINHVGGTLKLGPDDLYGCLSPETTVFTFGKTVGKSNSDFSREDISIAIISMVIQNLVNSFHGWALITGVRQVIFSGGLYKNHLVREMIGKYFAFKSRMNPLGKETSHYFIQDGMYLGALGALLKTLNFQPDVN